LYFKYFQKVFCTTLADIYLETTDTISL